MTDCYVGDYVVYEEFGRTKITTKENYEAFIRDASRVMPFEGTTDEAVAYIKKYFYGEVL